MGLGDRLRQRREEKGLSAAALAREAGISKGYLHDIENPDSNRPSPKPSADVLYRIATALGTTVADLLEKEVRPATAEITESLRRFLKERPDLPPQDVEMLALIRFRGAQPSTPEAWAFLYESIKRAVRE